MKTYCITVCITICHGFTCDREKAHCHTVELSSYIQRNSDDFDRFSNLEKIINKYLEKYNCKFLNEMPEFAEDTTIERLGHVIFEGLYAELQKHQIELSKIAIGETPLRKYIEGVLD